MGHITFLFVAEWCLGLAALSAYLVTFVVGCLWVEFRYVKTGLVLRQFIVNVEMF
jgi:hypothetical protein